MVIQQGQQHVKELIIQGGAFRKWHKFKYEPKKRRYFIILNKNPEDDETLLTVTATTQIDSVYDKAIKSNCSDNTLVEITNDDYDELPRNSIVDCNSITSLPKQTIIDGVLNQSIEVIIRPNDHIIQQLLAGVANSPTIEARHYKKII